MRVFILTEGGAVKGFGHIVRCCAIYDAFKMNGVSPALIINGDPSIDDFVKDRKCAIFNWLKERRKVFEFIQGADVVIVDSYLADVKFCDILSDIVKMPVFLDDINRMRYPRGVIVNGAPFADHIKYTQNAESRYLLGAKFILLKKEFWSVPRKIINEKVRKFMISFGGNDFRNMTQKILRYMDARYPDLIKSVIVGKGFEKRRTVEAMKGKNVRFLYNPSSERMRRVMLESDIALSAAGQTLSELAGVGVPTIAIAVAKNQSANLTGWQKTGFIKDFISHDDGDMFTRIEKRINDFMGRKSRCDVSRLGRRYANGMGAMNLVREILDMVKRGSGMVYDISIRRARGNDCYDLWSWRNHPDVRMWSYDKGKIGYEDHKRWFRKAINDRSMVIYMAENMGRKKIGQVRFDLGKHSSAKVNVSLNPIFFGRGLGSKLIRKATNVFFIENKRVKKVIAEIINGNVASQKAFLKAGYMLNKTMHKDGARVMVFNFKRNI